MAEKIIVLHGIFKSCEHMSKLTKFLRSKKYDVDCITYPSTKHNILELVDIIKAEIDKLLHNTRYTKVHFVGYSLGGVITRILLSKYKFDNLGRVVLLAPPNNGSEVASFLKNFWPYQVLWGPAGQELEHGMPNIQKHFKKIDTEVGVIAGNRTIDLVSSFFIINGDDDGKVSIESTKFKGMKDHVILPVSHTLMPYNKAVHEQTLEFIVKGRFKNNK